jgi:hypothetical protein
VALIQGNMVDGRIVRALGTMLLLLHTILVRLLLLIFLLIVRDTTIPAVVVGHQKRTDDHHRERAVLADMGIHHHRVRDERSPTDTAVALTPTMDIEVVQYNNDDYDRRYSEHPQRHPYEDRMGRRGTERPPHLGGDHFRGRDRHHRDTRDDGYYKGGMPPEGGRPVGGAPMVKRTTRVIGTATPIHVPRASEQVAPNRGSAASVFRGRPGADLGPSRGNSEESGPQKILMALRTLSTSFEEKPAAAPNQASRRSSTENDPTQDLGPQDPPQIQHSHHQRPTDASLFFEVRVTQYILILIFM